MVRGCSKHVVEAYLRIATLLKQIIFVVSSQYQLFGFRDSGFRFLDSMFQGCPAGNKLRSYRGSSNLSSLQPIIALFDAV